MNTAAKERSIFVSYARRDAPWVKQFADELQTTGIPVWSDIVSIDAGQSFVDALEIALRQSDTLIAIFSPNSLENPNVFFELGAALADDKQIIPILVGNVDEKQIPFDLSRRQWLRADSPTEAAKQVAHMLGAGAQNGSKPR